MDKTSAVHSEGTCVRTWPIGPSGECETLLREAQAARAQESAGDQARAGAPRTTAVLVGSALKFTNLNSLFRWAFGHREAVQPSSIYRLAKERDDDKQPRRRRRSGEALNLWERLAQQGMIKSYVRRLPPDMGWHIAAQYTIGKERVEAQNRLVDFILPRLPTGVHKRHFVYELVAKLYGKDVHLDALAERFNMESYLVLERFGQVKRIVESINERAYVWADQHYRDAGLIDTEYEA